MDSDSLSQTLNVGNMLPTFGQFSWYIQQTNIAMEDGSIEDVCPIEN